MHGSGSSLARTIARTAVAVLAVLGAGCSSAPRNLEAVRAYYDYDFTGAREALRGDALRRNDEQTILDNLRLGTAALADGDLGEAERALGRTFDLLSTAGLNRDRTTAAVLVHEGVKIWKGEPFEQALAYHAVAALYAVLGQWDNVRAAASNALFRLTDFGADASQESIARRAVDDEDYLESGYTAVDTNFALGFLMQAIGADLSGAAGAPEAFDAVLRIRPDLEDLVATLRARDYDTLLVVDYGKGPTKRAYGDNEEFVAFMPQDTGRGPLLVAVDGAAPLEFAPACDVLEMAQDHRWNNLEDVRVAKSLVGKGLTFGSLFVLSNAADKSSGRTALLGAGMLAAGLLMQAGARADVRYFEFAPQRIFVAPLRLGAPATLQVGAADGPAPGIVLPDVRPGTPERPRAIYLRLHGPDTRPPRWLGATALHHGNDHAGVRPGEGPWLLGGTDVSTPTREVLAAYQAHGWLDGAVLADLLDLYRAEGIHLGAGMENEPGQRRNPSFRHVLDGGTGLFTPAPDSIGYKRLMYAPHPPHAPRSEAARNAAAASRVPPSAPDPEIHE